MICKRAEILTYLGKADESLSSSDDALIDFIHPLAESVVQRYLESECDFRLHTEYLPAVEARHYGQPCLLAPEVVNDKVVFDYGTHYTLTLAHTPVPLLGLRAWVDTAARGGQSQGAFGPGTELTLGTDFWLDVSDDELSYTGMIKRRTPWPDEPRTVKVQYYGGFNASQLCGPKAGALKLATLKTIAKCYRSARAQWGNGIPCVSESIGKYSYSADPAQVRSLMGSGLSIPAEALHDLQTFRSYRMF